MDRGFYRCSMMFKDFPLLFIFISVFLLTVWQKRGSVEICFWHYRSITRTIDFLLALVLIAISKPPYNIGTIEHTSLPFFSSLCFCLLPTVDLLATCVLLSTVDSLGSLLSTEKSIKQPKLKTQIDSYPHMNCVYPENPKTSMVSEASNPT